MRLLSSRCVQACILPQEYAVNARMYNMLQEASVQHDLLQQMIAPHVVLVSRHFVSAVH